MFQEWCTKTSLNGISDLYDAKSQKCHFGFWLTVMICMFGLTALFITLNVMNYVNSPTVTNIDTIPDNNLEMPELLLCYKGGVNVAEMKNIGLTDEIIRAIQTGFLKVDENLNYTKLSVEFHSLLSDANLSIEDFYMNVTGFPCQSIVKRRQLAGSLAPLDNPCINVSNFIGKLTQPCLLFKENGYQKWPSPSTGGIQFSVAGPNGSQPAHFSYLDLTHSYEMVIEKNVLIATEQSVEIPLQYRTNVLMSLTKSIRIPKNKPCDPDTTFTAPNACYQRCYYKGVKKFCNCSLPGMTTKQLDSNISMCDVFQYHALSSPELYQENIICSNKCIPLCTEYLYTLTISYLPLINGENIANISIAFAYQQYTKIQEFDAFSWDVVVSNIGGQAGLWTGCSIVTIIQALFYLWISACQRNHRVQQLKVSDKIDQSQQ